MSLEALVRGATALANDGLLIEPRLIAGPGNPAPRRVLSESAARQVTLFLSDPMARLPGFPRMGPSEYPFPAAVKTGTSAGCRDAWALAWSARAVVGVWVGRPDFRPMKALGGYVAAAALARRILSLRHGDQLDGLSDRPFPPPRGYLPVRLCATTGLLPGAACDRVVSEWLAPGQEPQETCDHRAAKGASRDEPSAAAARHPCRPAACQRPRARRGPPRRPRSAGGVGDHRTAGRGRSRAAGADLVRRRPPLAHRRVPVHRSLADQPGAHTFQVRIPGQEAASPRCAFRCTSLQM